MVRVVRVGYSTELGLLSQEVSGVTEASYLGTHLGCLGLVYVWGTICKHVAIGQV